MFYQFYRSLNFKLNDSQMRHDVIPVDCQYLLPILNFKLSSRRLMAVVQFQPIFRQQYRSIYSRAIGLFNTDLISSLLLSSRHRTVDFFHFAPHATLFENFKILNR